MPAPRAFDGRCKVVFPDRSVRRFWGATLGSGRGRHQIKETHMSVTADKQSGDTAIRPFMIEIPEAEVEDLRARIVATRLPDKEPVDDSSQGVQLATMQALVRYWGTEYDLRRVEA